MSEDLLTIRNKIGVFFIFAAFLSAMMGLVFIDVVWMSDEVHEASFTEITQELILGVIVFLFIRHARDSVDQQPIRILVAGFFACMLIRELDFLFDKISHGSWFWFALAVTFASLIAALRHPRYLISGLADFMRHPAWGMMVAGMLTILVFSRLFGMNELWRHLMPDGYNRTVKNMAEEGSELLGYTLCLFATLGYLFTEKKK
ncbi:hypothetical protein [Pantoea coffeiphila]|uniref:Uncharacterized protein n=1 Tax=Pantoea coffeiphila TaxID=1465635 RepID=A0A2S9IA05_9GAMM|nr:hypothetical protein [Pantoea coffeiphila]PRD14618.1 hypothetical protein CQW29_15745 [Pantoea coffeiphila]